MNRETEHQILEFCTQQRSNFNHGEWARKLQTKDISFAAVTVFLANTTWYGHRNKLLQLAEDAMPGSTHQFSLLVKTSGFDCSRFSGMLKVKVHHDRK